MVSGCKESLGLPGGWRARRNPLGAGRAECQSLGPTPPPQQGSRTAMGAARADQHPPASLGQGLMAPGWAGMGLCVPGAGCCVGDGVPGFRDTSLIP